MNPNQYSEENKLTGVGNGVINISFAFKSIGLMNTINKKKRNKKGNAFNT